MDANTRTYEDITYSSNLNIINDFQLKSQIVDYPMGINGIEFIDNYFYRYISDFMISFIFEEFSVLNGKFNNPDIINPVQFSNVIAGYFSMIQQRKSAYEDLLNNSYDLKKVSGSHTTESK